MTIINNYFILYIVFMLRAGSHNYTCLLLVKKTIKLYYNDNNY